MCDVKAINIVLSVYVWIKGSVPDYTIIMNNLQMVHNYYFC